MIDYFAAHLWQLWLLMAVIFLISELSTGGFYILCFSIGAVVSMLLALCGVSLTAQVLVFAIASAICLFFVRPFMKKYFHGGKGDDGRASNADALMGRVGRVSERIEAGGYGRVAIDGDDWKALSDDGGAIEKGESVEVVGRESIIITVKKV